MCRTPVVAAAFLLALLTGPGATLRAQEEGSFQWSRDMERGQTLVVKGITGEIRAEVASGNRAEVSARKAGDREDFREVAIEVEEVAGDIVICAVYGSWNHGKGRCRPGHRDRDRDRRHRNVEMDVEVEYVVRVPAGVEFHGSMVSGPVRAEDLKSDVSASTVSGDIRVTTTETARAHSVSGDIEIEMGSLPWETMDLHTVSGDITLWLPDGFAADIDFNSLSGDFDTDFDMDVRRQRRGWVGQNLTATIGGGGGEISIQTVSGDVRLRRTRG